MLVALAAIGQEDARFPARKFGPLDRCDEGTLRGPGNACESSQHQREEAVDLPASDSQLMEGLRLRGLAAPRPRSHSVVVVRRSSSFVRGTVEEWETVKGRERRETETGQSRSVPDYLCGKKVKIVRLDFGRNGC